MEKFKKSITIIALCLIIILCAVFVFYLFKKNNSMTRPAMTTEGQKALLLQQLNSDKSASLTEENKQKLLNSLNPTTSKKGKTTVITKSKVAPISEAQKNALLNALKN